MNSFELPYSTLPMVKDEEELASVVIDSRFSVIKRLGYGGQSEVFLAEDLQKAQKE